jgi:hypothetical protein
MRIILYKTESERIKINKVLEGELELVGSLRDGSSITTPYILLQTNPVDYNYAYIPEFKRYYYINSMTVMRSKAFVIELKCDVLMTYKSEIMELEGVVSRLNTGSQYASRDIKTEVLEDTRRIDYDYTFTEDGSYILIGKGGV